MMRNRLIKPGGILSTNDLKIAAAIIEQATAINTKAAFRKDLRLSGRTKLTI